MVAAKRIKQLVQLAAVGLLLLTFLIFTQWEDVTSGTRLQRRSFGVGEQDDEELLALEKELDVDRILKEIQKNVSLGLQKKKQERHAIVLNHRRRLVNKGNDSEDSPFTTRSPHLVKPDKEPKLDQSRDKPLKDTKASRERTHRRHLKTFKWRTEPWGNHMFGQLNVHVWQAWCGNTIHDLRRNWFFPLYPDLRLSVSRFYVKHYESDYGQRIFGYIHPPLTGKYLFALSSDDTSELWLSTDEHPENVKPVAWVGNLTSFSGSYRTNVAEFTKYSTQLSRQIYLKKGQKYFVEALHKQGARQDHILVGWKIPGLPGFRYITGNSISMYIYDPNASPDVAKYAGYIPQTMPSHTHSHNWSVVLDREVHKFGTNKEPEVEHHKTRPPFLNFDYLFYKCKYEPSYLVKNFTLRRYEGVGLIHDSAVYPDDNTALTHMRPFDTCGHHRRYTDSHGNNLNITTSKHRNRTLYSEGSIKVFGPDGEGSVVTMSSDLSDAYPVEGDSLNGEQTSDKPIFRSMEERVRTIAEAYKDFNNSRTEQVQYDTIKPNDPRTSSHGNTNHFDPSNVNDEKTVVNIKKRSINDDNVVPKESNSQHRGAILNIAKRIHERLKQPLTRTETSDNNAVDSIKSHMDQAALSDAGNTYRQQSPITFQTYLPSIQELQGELTAKHSDQIVNQKKQDSRQVHQGSRQVYQDSKQFRRDSQQTHQDAQQVNQDSKQARRDSKQVYQDAQQVNQDSKHVNRDAQRAHQYARQVNQYSQQVYQDSKQFDQDAQQVKQDSKHVNRVTQQSHQGAQQVYQDSQQVYQDARQVHQDSRQVHQDSKQVYQDSKQVHQDARQVHQDSQQVYQDSKQVQQDSQKVQIRRATLRKLMAISVASQTQQVLPQPSKPFQTGQGTVYFHPGLKLNNSVLSKDSALLRVYSAREYIRRMQKLVQIYKYDVTSKQLSDQIYRRFGVRMQVPELRYYRDYNPWLYNQNITKCGTDGNVLLNENVAQSVVMRYMKSVDRVRPHKFKLERIINVQENHDVIKGDRYLIELELFHFETERKARVSQYVYQEMGYTDFCSPQNFHIRHHATVHVIIPVKNQGRWVQYFIDNMSELFVKTGDPHLNVIIVDFSSDDIDINEALKRSPLVRYRVITLSGPFQRAFGIQAGAAVISNPNDIVFMCDLHLEIPNNMIDIIRKHCIQGRMAFAPIVLRLHCGFTPTIPYGFWELQGYGLFAMYKSDFDRVGGMNYREFGTRWGGEDWELLDRVLLHKMEVERLRVPNFYHFHHSKKGMWGSPTIDVIHSDIGAQYYKNRNQIIPLYRPRKYIQIRPIRYSNTIKTKDKQRNLRVKRVPSRIVRYSSRVRRGYRPKQKPRGTDKNGAKIYY